MPASTPMVMPIANAAKLIPSGSRIEGWAVSWPMAASRTSDAGAKSARLVALP
jgi:hypothetical protein